MGTGAAIFSAPVNGDLSLSNWQEPGWGRLLNGQQAKGPNEGSRRGTGHSCQSAQPVNLL